jgi:hypothetical protein
LEKEYSINKVDAAKLLDQLLRDGVIYEPREGFLKKT